MTIALPLRIRNFFSSRRDDLVGTVTRIRNIRD